MKTYRGGHAMIWHQGRILLVLNKPKAKRRMWGHNRTEPYWFIPGGKQEPQDTSLLHTAQRETYEETGITLEEGKFLYHCNFGDPLEGWELDGNTYQFNVDHPTLDLTLDPDSDILDAQFFSPDDAVAQLNQLAVTPLRDPVLAILRGDTSRKEWHYALDDGPNFILKAN